MVNKKIVDKKIVDKKKDKSGGGIFGASADLVSSFINLGESMFKEIESIKNIPAQLNNASPPISGQPN